MNPDLSTTAPAVSSLALIVNPILRKYGVRSAAVFGSTVRGEAGPEGDVDLLVEYPSGFDLFDLFDLREELEARLKRKVDLACPQGLKRRIRDRILESQVRIL